MNDITTKCYVKNFETYNLSYHEYVFPILTVQYSSLQYLIFNSLTLKFIPVDELIENKILFENDTATK